MADTIFGRIEKDRATIVQESQNILSQNYPTLSFQTGSVEQSIVEAVANTYEEIQKNYFRVNKQLSIATAEGEYLDRFGTLIKPQDSSSKRKSGANTIIEVQIITINAITLYGLDQTAEIVFTIKDDQNNNYFLISTQQINSAGTYTVQFQSEEQKTLNPLSNTVNIISTQVPQVSSVNNASQALTVGSEEETDASYRDRLISLRTISLAGTDLAIKNDLLAISGVTTATVFNNRNNFIVKGVPARHLNIVVDGGTDEEIGAVLDKHTSVVSFFGTQTYIYTNPSGSVYIIKYDLAESLDYYLRFNISTNNGTVINATLIANLKNEIEIILIHGVGELVTTINVANTIKQALTNLSINVNAYNFELSLDNSTWSQTIDPALTKYKPAIASSRITITAI